MTKYIGKTEEPVTHDGPDGAGAVMCLAKGTPNEECLGTRPGIYPELLPCVRGAQAVKLVDLGKTPYLENSYMAYLEYTVTSKEKSSANAIQTLEGCLEDLTLKEIGAPKKIIDLGSYTNIGNLITDTDGQAFANVSAEPPTPLHKITPLSVYTAAVKIIMETRVCEEK